MAQPFEIKLQECYRPVSVWAKVGGILLIIGFSAQVIQVPITLIFGIGNMYPFALLAGVVGFLGVFLLMKGVKERKWTGSLLEESLVMGWVVPESIAQAVRNEKAVRLRKSMKESIVLFAVAGLVVWFVWGRDASGLALLLVLAMLVVCAMALYIAIDLGVLVPKPANPGVVLVFKEWIIIEDRIYRYYASRNASPVVVEASNDVLRVELVLAPFSGNEENVSLLVPKDRKSAFLRWISTNNPIGV
jgi:hypothetical protein